MGKLYITDTRTLKKRLNNLYDNELILNKVDKLPKSKPIIIKLNKDMIENKHFSQLNSRLFDYLEQINDVAFRLAFYYKSHINMNDKDKDRSFCFVGYDTIQQRLKIGSTTLSDANEMLRKSKLVKIEKHKLEESFYNELDELSFSRYNNHYKIRDSIL